MNNKGQFDGLELNPAALILAVIGGLFATVMSAGMMSGIMIKVLVFLCTTVACYLVVSKIFS